MIKKELFFQWQAKYHLKKKNIVLKYQILNKLN